MRSQGRATRSRGRIAPVHAALATVLGLLVMPFAFAGARSPEAKTSAPPKAQIKSLKKRVAALESRISAAPSGPAGGDLTGLYPSPLIGPSAVGSEEIADNAIMPADISPNTIGQEEIATSGVGQADLAVGAVHAPSLANTSLVQSGPVTVQPGTSQQAIAACPNGARLLGGGFAWQNNTDSTAILMSSPVVGLVNTTWVAEGRIDTGGTQNTLFAEALCLSP